MTAPDCDNTDRWLADVLRPEPSAAPEAQVADASGGDASVLDVGTVANPDRAADTDTNAPATNVSAIKAAMTLGVALTLALVAIVAAVAAFNRSRSPLPQQRPSPATAVVMPPGEPSGAVAPDQDQAIPFTASATCPAGSTSAQALTDTGTDSAWVCVRGGEGAAVDGQVLQVDLGKAFVLTAVSVTPGWVAKTPGGHDEWLQHRVVTRLQYIFNDTDRTIVVQDTANTHGPVTLPLQRILASRVTVVVLQTSRPPAEPAPAATSQSGGFVDSLLGAGGAPPPQDVTQTSDPEVAAEQGSDPVDATFAISTLKFLGHPPN